MEEYLGGTPIKQWAEEDRPREKLMSKGRAILTNAELLAILLGSGNRKESAVDVAKRILDAASNNLLELSKMNAMTLSKFSGVGAGKAVRIIAALELGNRKQSEHALRKAKISSSNDAYEIARGYLADAVYEEFWIFLLNRANRLLQSVNISEGGVSGTVADPKKIFRLALEQGASSLILCHNHPSGNIQPSESDVQLTRKMKDAGRLLDVSVLDHIILGANRYFSFADEGMM